MFNILTMTDMENEKKNSSWEMKVRSIEYEADQFLQQLRKTDSNNLDACLLLYCFDDGGNFVTISRQTSLRDALFQVAEQDKFIAGILTDIVYRLEHGHYKYNPSQFRLEKVED